MTYETNCQSCGCVYKFHFGRFKCLSCWKKETFRCVDCDLVSNGMRRCLSCWKKDKKIKSLSL